MVDLADDYMRIWVCLEDIHSFEFFVPNAIPEEEQLVGFQLSIPMGYVEYTAFFCATTETVNYRALGTLPQRNTAPQHPLESLAETIPPQT